MENRIQPMEPTDLIEENPMDNGSQAPIYLTIDWENGIVDVAVVYETNSVPMSVFNGLETRIRLPGNIDASKLAEDVDDLMSRLDEIREGFESVWDGRNNVGRFTDEARETTRALTMGD